MPVHTKWRIFTKNGASVRYLISKVAHFPFQITLAHFCSHNQRALLWRCKLVLKKKAPKNKKIAISPSKVPKRFSKNKKGFIKK